MHPAAQSEARPEVQAAEDAVLRGTATAAAYQAGAINHSQGVRASECSAPRPGTNLRASDFQGSSQAAGEILSSSVPTSSVFRKQGEGC